MQALQAGDADLFAVHCTPLQHQWLQALLQGPQLPPAEVADLLLGSTGGGRLLSADTYGCMQQFCQVRQKRHASPCVSNSNTDLPVYAHQHTAK